MILNRAYTKTDLVFGFTGNKILVKVSPDKKRRGLYSLNFISGFIRKPLSDEYNMTNTENLIHNKDSSETHITLKTFYGSRYILYTINLGLLCFLLILGIISVALYSISTKREISTSHMDINSPENTQNLENKKLATIISNKENKGKEDFDIIFTKNIFSAERKEWLIKPKLTEPIKPVNIVPTIKTPPKPPKKIVLYGIIMMGNVKKAMVNNPNVGVRSKKTIYLEEGDDIEGYKVKSIESDQVKLDWQGEEIILKLYADPEKKNQSKESEIPG